MADNPLAKHLADAEARIERLEQTARRAREFLRDFHRDNQREVIFELDAALTEQEDTDG